MLSLILTPELTGSVFVGILSINIIIIMNILLISHIQYLLNQSIVKNVSKCSMSWILSN